MASPEPYNVTGPLDPNVIAADYIVAAIGGERARLALAALRAGWLTPAEAGMLEPLAAGIAYILGAALPDHRGPKAEGERPAPPEVLGPGTRNFGPGDRGAGS